jgi:hypothetical protein
MHVLCLRNHLPETIKKFWFFPIKHVARRQSPKIEMIRGDDVVDWSRRADAGKVVFGPAIFCAQDLSRDGVAMLALRGTATSDVFRNASCVLQA